MYLHYIFCREIYIVFYENKFQKMLGSEYTFFHLKLAWQCRSKLFRTSYYLAVSYERGVTTKQIVICDESSVLKNALIA